MKWISINDRLPQKEGAYNVQRQWGDCLRATGQTYWDGTKWLSGDMNFIAGPIIAWKPREEDSEKSSTK
jgi:hypothetical protein